MILFISGEQSQIIFYLISTNNLEHSMTGDQSPTDIASTAQLALQPYYIRLQGIPHINNIDPQQIQLV